MKVLNRVRSVWLLLFLVACISTTYGKEQSEAFTNDPVKTIAINLPKDAGKIIKNIASVFIARIEQRSGAKARIGTKGELKIELSIDTSIENDGFQIVNGVEGCISI
ncbi:MAG TPA: hypothetical protein VFI29_04090 [Hanamia sp.]|nr:hypothetical protein [Hanamia sp.]